jgi:ureidoglycolate hydrolase
MIGGCRVNDLIEIKCYDGKGYQPLIDFGSWRVAILRWEEASLPENIGFMERHTQTDEVFVLLDGKATLILGGKGVNIEGIFPQAMELGKVYNIKQYVWHTVILSRDASILIVENQDTGFENSEHCKLSEKQKMDLQELGL